MNLSQRLVLWDSRYIFDRTQLSAAEESLCDVDYIPEVNPKSRNVKRLRMVLVIFNTPI